MDGTNGVMGEVMGSDVQGEGVRAGVRAAGATPGEVLSRLGLSRVELPVAATDLGGRIRLVGELVGEARRLLYGGDEAGADWLLSEVQRVIG